MGEVIVKVRFMGLVQKGEQTPFSILGKKITHCQAGV